MYNINDDAEESQNNEDDTDEDPTYEINDNAEESQNNEGRPIAFKHLISKKYKLITYLSNQKLSKTNLTN